MTVEILNRHFDAVDKVQGIASHLFYLASAFRNTGNDTMAQVLTDHANGLEEAADELQNSLSDYQAEYISSVSQGTHNMMAAVMVMATKQGKVGA